MIQIGIFYIDGQTDDNTLHIDTPAGTIVIDYEQQTPGAITISTYSLLVSDAPLVTIGIPTAALSEPISNEG